MKSTMTKREKEQRTEWVVNRMDQLRKGCETNVIEALLELYELRNEFTWLTR